MPPPRRPLLARAALGGLVALALLALVEGGLRLALGPPPPAVRVISTSKPDGAWFEQDAAGRLVPRWQSDPLPFDRLGRNRIAVLGGSSVHGGSRGVTREAEFPALLGAALGVEALNLASPGLDSFDHAEITRELLGSLRAELGLLVIYAGHNDFAGTWYNERYGSVPAGLEAHLGALLGHLQLYCQLHRRLRPPEGTGATGGRTDLVRARPSTAALAQTRENLAANLRQIAWQARQRQIPLLVVAPASNLWWIPPSGCRGEQPCLEQVVAEAMRFEAREPERAAALLRAGRDGSGPPVRAPTGTAALMEAVAKDGGAAFLDAEAGLPHRGEVPLPDPALFEDLLHLSAAGHAAMATLLAPEAARLLGQSGP